ncbi:recombinase family protein [Clostridium psychrophilum]|uniref:recombinase family protein n=1 Tax=Clostridium psychrophilum TaxID=132926 RepID=UPI001C0E1E74|nr:recombinase family protein [Clostridium psychrophilum]MBU3182727.1 recombinase family protein [Clostridium psychrophilum]
MNIAYNRVSSNHQNDDRQFKEFKNYNIEKWFNETTNGIETHPQLKAMMDFIRCGDTIYVLNFSSIARSTEELLTIGEQLESKGINLICINENLDTSTSTGKLMFTMIKSLKKFQKTTLLERQKKGIAIAKANGKYKGRKKINFPLNWEEIYTKYKDRQLTGTIAMEMLKLKRNTFYKLVDEYKRANNK